jgi:hypothetical protein
MSIRKPRRSLAWLLLLALFGLQLHGLWHDHAHEAREGRACEICDQMAQHQAVVVAPPAIPLPEALAAPVVVAAIPPAPFVSLVLPPLRGPPASLQTA